MLGEGSFSTGVFRVKLDGEFAALKVVQVRKVGGVGEEHLPTIREACNELRVLRVLATAADATAGTLSGMKEEAAIVHGGPKQFTVNKLTNWKSIQVPSPGGWRKRGLSTGRRTRTQTQPRPPRATSSSSSTL